MKPNKILLAVIIAALMFVTAFNGKTEKIFDQKTQMPKISELRVSSILPHNNDLYLGAHLVDGSAKSWVEGVQGPGTGERIMFIFDAPVKLSCLYIKNGLGDSRWYKANNRVKELQFESSIIFSQKYEKKKFVIKLNDTQDLSRIDLPEPVLCRDFELTITSVYKGSRFDDTCISEISFKPITVRDKPGYPALKKPVKIDIMGYNLVLHPEGKMTGKGSGMCQVDCPFERGSWGVTNDGGYYLDVVSIIDSNAGDIEAETPGEWIESHQLRLLDKLETPEQ